MTNRQTKLDVGVTQRDFFKTQRYFFKNRRFFPLSRLPFFVCQYVTPLLHPSHPQKQGVRLVFIGDVTPVHPFSDFFACARASITRKFPLHPCFSGDHTYPRLLSENAFSVISTIGHHIYQKLNDIFQKLNGIFSKTNEILHLNTYGAQEANGAK